MYVRRIHHLSLVTCRLHLTNQFASLKRPVPLNSLSILHLQTANCQPPTSRHVEHKIVSGFYFAVSPLLPPILIVQLKHLGIIFRDTALFHTEARCSYHSYHTHVHETGGPRKQSTGGGRSHPQANALLLLLLLLPLRTYSRIPVSIYITFASTPL